jgi:hypothetical protein
MVDMQGIKFIPEEIHVAPGATVMWMNSSPLAHTVTADDGSFDSGNMDAGATFSLTFDAPGIYTYYCAPHKSIGMIGTVVVDDPGAATEGAAPEGAAPEPVMEPDPGAEPAAPVANPLPARDTNPTDYYPDH